MAEFVTIEAEVRLRAGKGAARATRRVGKVPAVLYGAGEPPELLALDPRTILREIQRGGWRSRLYTLTREGRTTRALMRDIHFHPVSDQPIHVDFQRLAAGQPVRVAVAVHVVGEGQSPGLKRGGVLNLVRHAVDVYCDPEKVPAFFEADVSGLDINDNIRWSDLKGTADCRPTIVDRDFVILTIAPPTRGAEAAEGAEAAAAASAAPAAKAPAKAQPAKKG
jgi:large subunit ribosomal protein L25